MANGSPYRHDGTTIHECGARVWVDRTQRVQVCVCGQEFDPNEVAITPMEVGTMRPQKGPASGPQVAPQVPVSNGPDRA